MSGLFNYIWSNIVNFVTNFRIVDVVDIAIVAFIAYNVFKLIKETRAMQLLRGVIVIIALWVISLLLNMYALNFILQNILSQGLLLVVLLFLPEFRTALAQFGSGRLKNLDIFNTENGDIKTREIIEELCEASEYMSDRRTGALIVIERDTKLGNYIDTGTVINSDLSAKLIESVFFQNSSLHDGAMIIRNGRAYAAGCTLPLSQNSEISKDLGTRHRAAVGISEVSDSFTIVISEETGIISIAEAGRIQRPVSKETLRGLLEKLLIHPKKHKNHKSLLIKRGGKDDKDG